MPGKMCGLILLTCMSVTLAQTNSADRVKAQRDREDRLWAQKSGLPASDVRTIRLLVGVSDTMFGSRILNIDAESLKQRKHILVVAGGACVKVHVLQRGANGFVEVWSLDETPPRNLFWSTSETAGHPGRGICPQSPQPASAHATPDGRILLEVPILVDPFQRTLPVSTYSFRWDGSKYELADEDR